MTDSEKRIIPRMRLEEDPNEGMLARLKAKVKKDPAVVLGMTGWTGIVGYALYNVRNRKTPLGLYLIHTRVAAQVFAMGSMVSVVCYKIFQHSTKTSHQKELSDIGSKST